LPVDYLTIEADFYRVQKSSTAIWFICVLIFVVAILHIRKKPSAEVWLCIVPAPCAQQLQNWKLVMALSQRLTRLSYMKLCLESEVEDTHFIAILYACRNGSVMFLLVLASY
jgi:hypothetical protein